MTDYNAKAREIVDNLAVGDCLPHLEQWQYDATVSTLESVLQAAGPATELRGKIRQLCNEAIKQGERRTIESFAREVLAQLEGP